jgi:F420-dependent oxidoreductase-like protein
MDARIVFGLLLDAMDLCLMIEGQEGVTWPQWRALARACEQHGVPALFRSDHYLNLDGNHPERGSLDAWATVNALAADTSTLRLGTLVSPITFRHPSVLAKLVTTADQISGGRIELGIGAGWHEREHAAYGFPFPNVRSRMDLLEEQLEIVLGNWCDGPFSFEGEHYRLRELEAEPKPVQSPHPPVIIGGNAGPRSSALAGRIADEYNTLYATVAEVRERQARVAEACERAGREPIPLSIMTVVIVGTDEDDLRQRVSRIAQVRGLAADELRAAPRSGWIVGVVPQAAERLIELREAGVSRVICQHFDHDDLEFVALLGDELAPLTA